MLRGTLLYNLVHALHDELPLRKGVWGWAAQCGASKRRLSF